MSKPVKGNKNKRPPSDAARLALAHLRFLKRKVALVKATFEVPEGFKSQVLDKTYIRIKGLGAQAIAASKGNPQVVKAIANREWNKVVSFVPYEEKPIPNYECKKKVDDFGNEIIPIKKEVVIKKNKATK